MSLFHTLKYPVYKYDRQNLDHLPAEIILRLANIIDPAKLRESRDTDEYTDFAFSELRRLIYEFEDENPEVCTVGEFSEFLDVCRENR